MIKSLSLILLLIYSVSGMCIAQSQSIEGQWKTIDDETNKPKSVVEITARNGKLYGKITQLFREPNEDPDPLCTECPVDDPRFNQRVIGMEIIQSMEPDEEEYSGGTILDPKVGKVYRCRLWLEGENLKVRGYWGPFYRTQTWHRYR